MTRNDTRDNHESPDNASLADFNPKRIVTASLPRPPHINWRQPRSHRLQATVVELHEDRTVETKPRRRAVEPHFTVTLEHDTSTHRDGRTTLEGTAGAGIVADLLPVPPSGCAIVLGFDHAFYYAPDFETNEQELLSRCTPLLRVFFKQLFDNSIGGERLVYTMLNNQEASKFDLYLPGRLVASLHYKIDEELDEVMFVYCEAIDGTNTDAHCRELMKQALEDARGRTLTVNVTCPIALKYMEQNEAQSNSEPRD